MVGDTYEFRVEGELICWLCEDPAYCTRGRYRGVVEFNTTDPKTGRPINTRDGNNPHDPWPRYYFNLPWAMLELQAYLEAHGFGKDRGGTGVGRWTKAEIGARVDMDHLVETGEMRVVTPDPVIVEMKNG